MKVKKSFGIALCRILNGKKEILMIKKRRSYYFYNFVLGYYNKTDEKKLAKIFNNITFAEKIDILSLNFDVIWCRLWNTPKSESYTTTYKRNRERFENIFLYDGGKKLSKMINSSHEYETPWEIPKGKKNDGEKDMDAAIREFEEETNIQLEKYEIIWNAKPIIDSYIDDGIFYESCYFIARPSENIIPKINFKNSEQILEVESIKWININEIKYLTFNEKGKKRLYKLSTRIFAEINRRT
jgi:8-oxo-dGTP pyrophosphatase MutT (NUDIX family)